MKIQILNSFRGDDVKDIDTTSPEGRGTAAKLIADLLRTGSALFLEQVVNGETYTYRVVGYDQERDKIKLALSPQDRFPEDAVMIRTPKQRGSAKGVPRRHRYAEAAVGNTGMLVSVAPVAGGVDGVEEAEAPSVELTWEGIRHAAAVLCEQRGWHHGCPLPSSTNSSLPLVVAKGAPLYDKSRGGSVNFGEPPGSFVCTASDVDEDVPVKFNEWRPVATRVCLYRDSKGTFQVSWPADHERLHFWLNTIAARAGAMDWNTELVAMSSLQDKITESQWCAYVLSGAFPETSKRSGVTYILRRGLPTLALRITRLEDNKEKRHFLAALCLHPMAYYENTWAGSQPPSDEVIAHLMMIRANEHGFWKRAGQHPLDDPRSGV